MPDVLRAIGVKPLNHVAKVLMKRCEDLGIDFSHLKYGTGRLIDLTGQVFGRLQVIERAPTAPSGGTMWFCREIDTGIVKPVYATHLMRGKTKSFSFGASKGSNHHQWSGCGDISGNYWNSVTRKAASRQLPLEVTLEYVWNLFLAQDRKCALSGVSLYFGETGQCPYTASLDRIDSSKGYIVGNVQWVHKHVNLMKNRLEETEFFDFCRKIAARHPEQAPVTTQCEIR